MKILLKWLVMFAGGGAIAILAFYLWATASTYPSDRYAEILTYGEPPPPTASDTLTVVSYNIGYLSGLTNAGSNSDATVEVSQSLFDQNLATAIAALAPLNADVIALQEIDLASKRSYHVNQVQKLAESLGISSGAIAVNWDKNYVPFPYWPLQAHFGKTLAAQAILSRHPIQKNDRIVLEKVAGNPFYYNALYLDRLAQVSEIEVGGRALVMINVHLEAFDNPTRLNQTQVVKDLAERYAQDHPVLLVGDFNSAVNRDQEGADKSIRLLTESAQLSPAVLADRWSETDQFTFPSDVPAYKLDYIFYTPETIEMIATRVVTDAAQASDHLPLAMTFRFK
ncbi:MAG: endonuclease/exonuclease/phosphatase family protein [Cyanobacteria bacterium P01_G01_bin.38]